MIIREVLQQLLEIIREVLQQLLEIIRVVLQQVFITGFKRGASLKYKWNENSPWQRFCAWNIKKEFPSIAWLKTRPALKEKLLHLKKKWDISKIWRFKLKKKFYLKPLNLITGAFPSLYYSLTERQFKSLEVLCVDEI